MAQIKKTYGNILTGEDLNTAYKRYVSRYNDTARRMKSQGLNMFIEKMNKVEFQNMYAAVGNQMDQDSGKSYASEKAKMTKIIDSIVAEQRYELSAAQAKAYQTAYREKYGESVSITDIHKMAPDQLREMNDNLKAEGIGSYERRKIISAAFFGSE